MKNKHFLQFVAILLCTTLLTFSAGRVTRVKAVVSEAAIATGVAIIVGTAFIGYLALCGATVHYFHKDTLNDYVGDVGRWVMEHGSGVGLTRLIAQASDWVGRQALNALDFTVEYTKDLISDFYNSFNNIDLIHSGISVTLSPNPLIPTLNFSYPTPTYATYLNTISTTSNEFRYEVMPGYTVYNIACNSGSSTDLYAFELWQLPYNNLVNFQYNNDLTHYYVGQLNGTSVTPLGSSSLTGSTPYLVYSTVTGLLLGYTRYIASSNFDSVPRGIYIRSDYYTSLQRPSITSAFPSIADKPLYIVDANNQVTSLSTDVAIPNSTSVSFPNHGGGNDDDNRNSIIPFVPFPNSPTNPNGFWGSLVDDILDAIDDGLDLAILSELLNAFADGHGGDSILYDDDVINYYYKYDIKNNITQQSEEMPIDLNELSLYTDNRYLTTLTDSVDSVSDVIHDYVGFWYDVDPSVVIVILGSVVLSVVSLFLHKMGG